MREKEKPSFTGFMNMFFGHRKSYTITVELPRGVAANAELSSCNAAIDVAHGGMSGELKLSTSNARISVGNICMDGSIHCKTSNARISLQDVEAQQICAHTTNGRIEAEHLMILDRAELVTTNGRIHLQDIQGGSAVLRTTNGSVNVDHGDLKALSMTSSNGAIRAKLAGTIRDYSVESGTSNGSNTLPASMPGGTRDLKAHTSNGSIKVEFDS